VYYYICKNSATQKGIWAHDESGAAIRFIIWYVVQHTTKPAQQYAVEVKSPGTDSWQRFIGNYESFFVSPK